MYPSGKRILSGVVTAVTLTAACGDPHSPQQLGPTGPALSSVGRTLVECPVDHEKTTAGILDAVGGSITLDNHALTVPPLALLVATQFRLTAPASNHMAFRVTAVGLADFVFEAIVSITIDYSRCARGSLDDYELTVWKIDAETKALLEHMGGVDDKASRTITFQTGHLSTYSLAR